MNAKSDGGKKRNRYQSYDSSWYTEAGLGLKVMAVTAPVWPLRTEIGSPSARRHCGSITERLIVLLAPI